jgi:hypothetical protein
MNDDQTTRFFFASLIIRESAFGSFMRETTSGIITSNFDDETEGSHEKT